jgi:2-oxoglutarate-Fe(II)-dependent oxygenase superfamily protein
VEDAFSIPVGTFDSFFQGRATGSTSVTLSCSGSTSFLNEDFLCPQHRLKLVKYHVTGDGESQGVGAHKDSSGWLTFLYQVGTERGLEVLGRDGTWLPANPIPGSFVVNFGNAFEAATEGAVRATVHRVKAPTDRDRYSIPFFMGLPLDLKISEIRSFIPQEVRSMRRKEMEISPIETTLPSFLDPRWDSLGESVLRKWIRSHPEIGSKWYGSDAVEYYTQ